MNAEHYPLAVTSTLEFPDWVFIKCACGEHPIANVWLREHWAGEVMAGKAAVANVIEAQAGAAS